MKAQRLILEGDALRYKGDWVTNTAYNINDCVTWATDGHLYEVIKAHTSSSTFAPDNPEYYKAMTAKKFGKREFNPNTQGYASVNAALKNIIDKDYDALIEFVYNGQLSYIRAQPPAQGSYRLTAIVSAATGSSKVSYLTGYIPSASKITLNGFYFDTADGSMGVETYEVSVRAIYYHL